MKYSDTSGKDYKNNSILNMKMMTKVFFLLVEQTIYAMLNIPVFDYYIEQRKNTQIGRGWEETI